MAWAKGRQAAEETAKAECLRRWPKYALRCRAVWLHGEKIGYIVEATRSVTRPRFIAGERSASETWSATLGKLAEGWQP